MNYEINFLNRIYQNSKMGEQSIDTMLKNVKNPRLRHVMEQQKEGYSMLSRKAQRQLHLHREIPQDKSKLSKLSSQLAIQMKLQQSQKPSHLAGMLIQGSTMGIIDATQHLHKYRYASPCVKNLAGEVIRFEEKNIQQLKHYL